MLKIEDMDRVDLNKHIESVLRSFLEPEEKSKILKKAYARLEKLDLRSALVESSEDATVD